MKTFKISGHSHCQSYQPIQVGKPLCLAGNFIMENKWYPIPGLENYYEVNLDGQVKSISRSVPYKSGKTLKVIKEKILKQCLNTQGYRRSIIAVDKIRKGLLIHRVLAELFIPNPKNKPHINHINGVRHDNRLENLEWVTHKENMEHSTNVLGNHRGERNGNSKLTKEQVEQIRIEYVPYKNGAKILGKKYGVSRHMIGLITRNINWKK